MSLEWCVYQIEDFEQKDSKRCLMAAFLFEWDADEYVQRENTMYISCNSKHRCVMEKADLED